MVNNTFKYEDISQEDIVAFGIADLARSYGEESFRKWSVNETKDAYLIRIPDTFGNLNNPDDMVDSYVMNINGLWADFEIIFIDSNGIYRGETWIKYGIRKVSPYVRDISDKKHILSVDELPISHETILSLFCNAVTAESNWMNDTSAKHTVLFDNLTAVEVQS